MKFENIYKETEENIRLALLSLWTPGNHPMRPAIEELFDREPLLAEPVFQSTFGWEPSPNEDWRNAINHYAFEMIEQMRREKAEQEGKVFRPFSPFKHQAESWEMLAKNNSIVVTSGTGSGKTECFMYPVVSDLYEQGVEQNAIEAIFLYPLNALMEDQKERLSDFCNATGLRFAVYNGDTPEYHEGGDLYPCEIGSRDRIRDNNENGTRPQILLTNPSMLEYILVRQKDQNMLQQSAGRLRWIVIDEAHSYSGSAAVELAYQIKRILDAFGVAPNDVRFACTSATIGGESGETSLTEFISNITGQPIDHIKVIGGNRLVQPINQDSLEQELQANNLPSAERVISLRNKINEVSGMSLQQIWEWLKPDEAFNKEQILPALHLLDQLCEMYQDGKPVLSLRAHFFMRSINGIYACANEQCHGHNKTIPLYGYLTTYNASVCPHCGAPLLDLVQCNHCKDFILMGDSDNQTHKIAPCEEENYIEDFFSINNNDEDEYDEELITAEHPDRFFILPYIRDRFFSPLSNAHVTTFNIVHSLQGTTLNVSEEDNGKWVEVRVNNERSYCPDCGSLAEGKRLNFNRFRTPISFINQTIAPVFLQESASNGHSWGKYIAFTDSRQGTAISAKTFNINSERNQGYKNIIHALATYNPLAGIPEEYHAIILENLGLNQNNLNLNQLYNSIFDERIFQHITGGQNEQDYYKSAVARYIIGQRPIYKTNAETMGYFQISYPALNNITIPEELETYAIENNLNINDTEWQNYLKICLDFFFRAGNHIHPFINGIEYKYRREKNISTPVSRWDDRRDNITYWSLISTNHNGEVSNKQNRLVLLLCAGMHIDSIEELDRNKDLVNRLLMEAWNNLTRLNLIKRVEADDHNGYNNPNYYRNNQYVGCYYLDLSNINNNNTCQITKVRTAWLCPVSSQFLDTTFCGYSPLIHGEISPNLFAKYLCHDRVELPQRPQNDDDVNTWLENDPNVENLKNLGLWTDRHKYVYKHTPSFIAAEHSAQQSKNILQSYVNSFKQPNPGINVLHCSTTMEMGVDIGDIDIVIMDTIPPSAANYLQRVGRAGRMGQTKSIAFSFCNNTPVGQQAFANPMWALMTTNHMSNVIPSQIIIQRHINSFLFRQFICEENGIPTNLTKEEFMNDSYDRFVEFLENMAVNQQLIERFHSVFGNDTNFTIGLTKERIEQIRNDYVRVVEELESAFDQVEDEPTRRIAISNQLRKFKSENLLNYLSVEQFIPNANMPTDVVSFDFTSASENRKLNGLYTEAQELRRQIGEANNNNPDREIFKQRLNNIQKEISEIQKATSANRDIRTALNEYAPGQTIVINEKNYVSAGISMFGAYNEETQTRAIYHCTHCGHTEYSETLNEQLNCPICNNPYHSIINRNNARFTLAYEPKGFRTDATKEGTREEETEKRFYDINPILLETDWNTHNQINMCEMICSDRNGKILFYNIGKKSGYGFAFCKRCGRAAIEYSNGINTDTIPTTLHPGHNSLWGGICDANNDDIARHVVFTGYHPTCYTVLRFKKDSINADYENDKELAYSMGVVLCKALALHEGIDEGEIDFGVKQEINTYVLFIYDTAKGGCGYSLKLMDPTICQEVFDMARVSLEESGCLCHIGGGACTRCLINRTNYKYSHLLSKAKVLNWLTLQKEMAFEIPDSVRQNSPHAQIAFQSLKQILKQAISNPEISNITLCASDNTDDYTITDWNSIRSEMGRYINMAINNGKTVSLKIEYHPEYHETLSDKLPFINLNDKFVDCDASLISDMGPLKTAIILENTDHEIRHFFTDKDNVLSFSNKWGEDTRNVFIDRKNIEFEETEEPAYLQNPSIIIREGLNRTPFFHVKNYFSDAIARSILRPEDIDSINNILRGKTVNIEFSDSFVNSALASLMLVYLIKEMKDLFNFNIDNVMLQLNSRNRNCSNYRFNDWTYINLNFPDEETADEYTNTLFENVLGVTTNFSQEDATHHRWLKFTTQEESSVEIRPDHSISGGFRSDSRYLNIETLNGNVNVTQDAPDILFYVIIKRAE